MGVLSSINKERKRATSSLNKVRKSLSKDALRSFGDMGSLGIDELNLYKMYKSFTGTDAEFKESLAESAPDAANTIAAASRAESRKNQRTQKSGRGSTLLSTGDKLGTRQKPSTNVMDLAKMEQGPKKPKKKKDLSKIKDKLKSI